MKKILVVVLTTLMFVFCFQLFACTKNSASTNLNENDNSAPKETTVTEKITLDNYEKFLSVCFSQEAQTSILQYHLYRVITRDGNSIRSTYIKAQYPPERSNMVSCTIAESRYTVNTTFSFEVNSLDNSYKFKDLIFVFKNGKELRIPSDGCGHLKFLIQHNCNQPYELYPSRDYYEISNVSGTVIYTEIK